MVDIQAVGDLAYEIAELVFKIDDRLLVGAHIEDDDRKCQCIKLFIIYVGKLQGPQY